MKVRLGLVLLLTLAAAIPALAQQKSYYAPRLAAPSTTSAEEDVEQDGTVVEAPRTTIGSPKGTNPPGGNYGLGDPLCAPQYALTPRASGATGGRWWCDPCGFGGWGCGTPVRTFARNMKTQFTSILPCGPWCQSRGCNCSGQGPYAMDGSQPDRRSCPCDCQGSYYLFPWIWGYDASRGGCCINRWTQRGNGYRSSLQFNQTAGAQVEESEESDPVPPSPSDVEPPKAATLKMRNVSLEKSKNKPSSAVVKEVTPSSPEADAEETPVIRKPVPTGALSANYLTRMLPKAKSEEPTARAATASKSASSRRR